MKTALSSESSRVDGVPGGPGRGWMDAPPIPLTFASHGERVRTPSMTTAIRQVPFSPNAASRRLRERREEGPGGRPFLAYKRPRRTAPISKEARRVPFFAAILRKRSKGQPRHRDG